MSDLELEALMALVQRDAVLCNAAVNRYGQLMREPDEVAAAALRAELQRRGVIPPDPKPDMPDGGPF